MATPMAQSGILAVIAALYLAGAAQAAEGPDVGGLRLGMPAEEALKILETGKQNKVFVRNLKMTLNLTIDRMKGSFDNHVYGGQYTTGGTIVAFAVSPLTHKVWSITKTEQIKDNRPTLKAVSEAAGKFGPLDPKAIRPQQYKQQWMYDKGGKEIEWVNTYDKPRNGNCFEELKSYTVSDFFIGLQYPLAPTTACSRTYSITANSRKQDGLVDDYVIAAVDIGAFLDWYKVLSSASDKALEAEGKRAGKPSL